MIDTAIPDQLSTTSQHLDYEWLCYQKLIPSPVPRNTETFCHVLNLFSYPDRFGLLLFKDTFSTNRLYRVMGI